MKDKLDLRAEFGNWSTVYWRFPDGAKAGVFERMFNGLSDVPDLEVAMVDVSRRTPCVRVSLRKIVKVHRHGHGAEGGLKIRR